MDGSGGDDQGPSYTRKAASLIPLRTGISTTRQGENTKLGVWRLPFPPVLLKLVIILCRNVQDSEKHTVDSWESLCPARDPTLYRGQEQHPQPPTSGATSRVTPSQQERLRSKGVLRPLALSNMSSPGAGSNTPSPTWHWVGGGALVTIPTRRSVPVGSLACSSTLFLRNLGYWKDCCSVAQSCLTLYPMDCSIPGFPVLQHPQEFAQTHVH